MTETETTYVRPGYRRTSAGHKPIDGVQFFSYQTGISQFAMISEDGQIITSRSPHRVTYTAGVIGHKTLLSPSGRPTRFHTGDAAAKAAIKVWRKLQETK